MQSIILSSNQLIGLLHLLKKSLAFFDNQCYPKVTFVNDECLYRHIRECTVPANKLGKRRIKANIGEVLDILEPYIPFELTDENYELFMEAVLQPEEERLTHKAKLDFCQSLRTIDSPKQWEEALSVCESIRALKQRLETV